MSLTIILISLLAERFLLEHQGLRQPAWFSRYTNWFDRQELPNWLTQGITGIITLLLPPLLVTALLQQLLGETLFGIPGVHTLDFCRGLSRRRIRHVQARNEQGAGFMADGYARASGRRRV